MECDNKEVMGCKGCIYVDSHIMLLDTPERVTDEPPCLLCFRFSMVKDRYNPGDERDLSESGIAILHDQERYVQ